MNDKIRALVEPHLYTSYVGDHYRFGEQEITQFVQQIVQECCRMMTELEPQYPANLTVREIKNSFGVEL